MTIVEARRTIAWSERSCHAGEHSQLSRGLCDMDNSDLGRRVLELVNLARATYGAFALETLLRGQPRSASFCPIGRSLRIGVEYWLFVAVGTKYLRVWTVG